MQHSRWATVTRDPTGNHEEGLNRGRLFGAPPYNPAPSYLDYGDMVVCNFYQRGQCKFGDGCKFEHPGSQRDANRSGGGGFGGSNTNRFNAFGGGGGDRYRPGQQSGNAFGSRRDATPRFHLDRDDIKADLTGQRPIYPLSCYGPGRDAPRQLIEGPIELSPEELRAHYYAARTSGSESAAQQEETQLHEKMQEQVQTILNDLNGAVKYVEDGADVHPNRIDIAQGKVTPQPDASSGSSSSNPFSNPPANPLGTGSQTQGSAFGQTSTPAFGQTSTPAFGRPNPTPFGQPSNPGQTTSAFGQPSNPGQSTSAFGQTSALGGSAFGKPSMPSAGAFGQPSPLGGGSALGQGSAFGKPSIPGGGSAFGQTSALGQQSAFGQPSVPGATSAFGKPSAPGQASAFGQTSGLGQNNAFSKPAFGQSGFGQPSQPGAGSSPFGQQAQATQATPFGQAQQGSQSSPFGQQPQQPQQPQQLQQPQQPQSQQVNPFGKPQEQQTQAPSNPFGSSGSSQPSAFGQAAFGKSSAFTAAPSQPANPFATKTQNPAAAPSPFSAPTQQANPFSQQPQQQSPSPFAQQGQAAAAPGESKTIDPKDRFKEGKPEDYEGEKGRKLEEIYKRVVQTGYFNDDEDIPLVPPKCEWIVPAL